MNNQINITLSAVIEKATQQYLAFTQQIMQENKLSVDLIEFALEKALLFVKSQKLQLYSSALIELSNKDNSTNENNNQVNNNQVEQFMNGLKERKEN